MPQLNTLYELCPDLQQYFVDKTTGGPLSGGSVRFFSDPARTIPKSVYELSLNPSNDVIYTSLGSIVTLSSVGTFADSNGNDILVYLWPYDNTAGTEGGEIELYYISVYSSGEVLQFTRDAIPNLSAGNNPGTDTFENTENTLTNPAFSQVLFNTVAASYSFTVSTDPQSIEVAPGWYFDTTGTGSIVVKQIAVADVDAFSEAAGNPPYALEVTSSSITTLKLRQRLQGNARIFATGFVSGTLSAKSGSNVAQQVTMDYVPSSGTTHNIVQGMTTADNNWTLLNVTDTGANAVEIGPVINTGVAPSAYVDIQITLPINTTIQISNIQINGVKDVLSTTQYLQESIYQQTNKLYWYDKPQLKQKPIPSYLVGWDFPMNPAQLSVAGVVTLPTIPAQALGANTSYYAWDQTIIYQQATSAVEVSRPSTGNGAMRLTMGATTRIALVQYLDGNQIKELLNTPLCVNISAKASAAVSGVVSLWYTTGAAPVINSPSYFSLIATISDNGKPATFNNNGGSWLEVPRSGLGNAQFSIGTSPTNEFNDYPFSGWDLDGIAGTSTAATFAIVVGFGGGASGVPITTTIDMNSVSLQSGYIPTRPAPLTFEETLRQCEHYYEKSFNNDGIPGTSQTAVGALVRNMTTNPVVGAAGVISSYANAFNFEFKTIKRITSPNVYLYGTSATTGPLAGHVLHEIYNAGNAGNNNDVAVGNWAAVQASQKSAVYNLGGVGSIGSFNTGATAIGGSTSLIKFQYLVDARLGVI